MWLRRWRTEPSQASVAGEAGLESRFEDEQTEDSDLDVLVEFDAPIGLLDRIRLENELSDRLCVDVDLLTRKSLSPRLEARVTDDLVIV